MVVGMMASGVLLLLAGLIGIGLAANAVWRAIFAPPGMPRDAGCGSCGYELATLVSGRCSECGADLLKAGVMTRRNVIRTAGSLPAALLGWTLLVISVATVVVYAISIMQFSAGFGGGAAGAMPYTSNYTFTPARPPRADDGSRQAAPDFEVVVDVDITGTWGSPANSGSIEVEFTSSGQTATLTFSDVTLDQWVLTGPDGGELATGMFVEPEDVLTAFASVGLTPDSEPLIGEYAQPVVDLVDGALADPFMYETNLAATATAGGQSAYQLQRGGGTQNFGGVTAMSSGADLWSLVILGVMVFIWTGGMAFIVRRRSKLLRQPRAQPPAEPTPA